MKIVLTIAAVLSAVVVVVTSTNPEGVVYPFPIDSLLTCYVDNPLRGQEGQDDVIPEEIPLLSLDQIVRQNGHPNDIWLPPKLQFRTPAGIPLTDDLLNFLGSDYNPLLTATSRPVKDAPAGCVVGGAEGSGGVTTIREATPQSPTPLLLDDVDTINRVEDSLIADPATLSDETDNYDRDRLRAAGLILLNETNRQQELWEIWTGLCPLSNVWAELPDGYFPSYFSQGTCSGKNCSFPRGKFCEEDFTYTGSATVLRWDCCYNRELGQLRWDCGWRKVRIPIICDCSCACTEVNRR